MSEPEGRSSQLIRVEIYGQVYSIRTEGQGDYIHSLAEMVDRRMKEIARGTATVDSLKVAILALLHIAEELHLTRKKLDEYDHDLASRSSKCVQELDRFLRRSTADGAPPLPS